MKSIHCISLIVTVSNRRPAAPLGWSESLQCMTSLARVSRYNVAAICVASYYPSYPVPHLGLKRRTLVPGVRRYLYTNTSLGVLVPRTLYPPIRIVLPFLSCSPLRPEGVLVPRTPLTLIPHVVLLLLSFPTT